MKSFNSVRDQIKKAVVDRLSIVQGVSSLTFVGSFEHSNSISAISDIDIILIVDHLNEDLFNTIRNSMLSIKPQDCGLPDYRILLNTSFGPLKYNDEKSIVFHLMVYDMDAHRKHVNESPFTCYDWELHTAAYGKDLADIYPVQQLQLSDLIGTRRSLSTYLDDVEAGRISYREYRFTANGAVEQVFYKTMDDRHQKEYAYHIMKFMMVNTLKIFHQQNIRADQLNFIKRFVTLDTIFEPHAAYFLELVDWKLNAGPEPLNIVESVKKFITELEQWLISTSKSAGQAFFYRHARTTLNDGRFLGCRRNPGILATDSNHFSALFFDTVITSSLKRSIETGHLLSSSERKITPLLDEIDYGEAEGMNLEELKKNYPAIFKEWAEGKDPKFPGGENQADVAERMVEFLTSALLLQSGKSTAIVTHNVVLRALLGRVFHIPTDRWYLIGIDHLECFDFKMYQHQLLPELKISQRIRLRDQITQWKTSR